MENWAQIKDYVFAKTEDLYKSIDAWRDECLEKIEAATQNELLSILQSLEKRMTAIEVKITALKVPEVDED